MPKRTARGISAAAGAEARPEDELRERRPFYLLYRASLIVRPVVDTFGKGEGVTLAQFAALSMIAGLKEATTTSLARRLQISPQSVNEVIAALQASGYVIKSPSPSDGRSYVLSLSQEGFAQLRKAESAIDRAEDYLFEGVPEETRHLLWTVLARVIERGRAFTQAQTGDDRTA